jgi:hypothetical protein
MTLTMGKGEKLKTRRVSVAAAAPTFLGALLPMLLAQSLTTG